MVRLTEHAQHDQMGWLGRNIATQDKQLIHQYTMYQGIVIVTAIKAGTINRIID